MRTSGSVYSWLVEMACSDDFGNQYRQRDKEIKVFATAFDG